VTVSGGGGDVTGLAPDVDAVVPVDLRFGVANSLDEVRSRVRKILAGGADFIKVIATGAVLTEGTKPGAPEFTEDELRAAVDEAALVGAHVAAHAHGAEGIKRAVRAGVRWRPNTAVAGIADHEVTIADVMSYAIETLPADHVVIRTHGVPEDSLYHALRGRVPEVVRVGDAVAVRLVDRAIFDGHRAGRAL
jgi:hypothetical protein